MRSAKMTGARSLVVLVATLGMIASTAYGAPPELTNGVPLTGLSGGVGSEQLYRIEVPAGQDQLEITTSNGTGDVDLYVRRGQEPTSIAYDYRPYQVGNNETVTVTNPAAGTWYILLRGYNAYAGVTLKAVYSGKGATTVLLNGVPVEKLADATGGEQYFSIEVPADQAELQIKMSGGSGDADLYVRAGAVPTTSKYDFRPYLTGSDETVTVKNPVAGTWHVMIQARKAYSGVTLVAGFSGGVPALENGVPVTGLAGDKGSEKVYRIEVPAGQSSLVIAISGGKGDADLFVKFGAKPTTDDYDYRPFVPSNDETVTVVNPKAGTWYILIRSFGEYSDLTLRATYGDVVVLKDGVPVRDLAGGLNSETFFRIEVPSGQGHLLFQMNGGAGNADMYIRRGAKPTTTQWSYRPVQGGNNESISIGGPPAGTWYIMLKGAAAYSGLTLEVDYRIGSPITLKNNVPVTGIMGGPGDEILYKIEVPAEQDRLEIKMSGGTGDADMYIKYGAAPRISNYDYRPYGIGNEESVEIPRPQAGTWYILIRGFQRFAEVTLVAGYDGKVPTEPIVLQNGVAVAGIEDAAGGEKFFQINVPEGQGSLEIVTSGGSGDVDMYVRRRALPSTKNWDYRPYVIGNEEKVAVDKPQAGLWYVMLRGHESYKGVTLKATYFPMPEPVTELANGVPVTDLSGAVGSEMFFKIEVPAGQGSLTIATSGGTGNVDLYVRKGAKPTTSSYDFRPYLNGNAEKVEVADPAAAAWYIMLRGRQAYKGVTLEAEYMPVQDDVTPLENGKPVKGLSGAADSEQFFAIDVPAGREFLTVELAGGTGNANLYVRKGVKPSAKEWDDHSSRAGNDEKIEIAKPAGGAWYILVHGQKAYSGAMLTATYGGGPEPEGNDFASDPHCVAVWQFEPEAFAKDGIGPNVLDNHGVSAQTADVKEGAGSADFRAGQQDWMSIDDDHLSADFPTRSNDQDVELSICFWMKPRSFPYGSTLVSKYLPSTDDRSWRLFLGGGINEAYLKLGLGTGTGGTFKEHDFDAAEQRFAKDRWYHVAFTYRDSDRQFHVRLWDDTDGTLVFDQVGTAASRMALTHAPFVLGSTLLLSQYYDGLLDEVAVFNDVLTTEEIDAIREGRYSAEK